MTVRDTGPCLPSYIPTDLRERVRALDRRADPCFLCPRRCGAPRSGGAGFCRIGHQPVVASSVTHLGEEPVISGRHGSGTIFLCRCNMACVFCQNHQISQPEGAGTFQEEGTEDLALRMLDLQHAGCHNINWVSPGHQVHILVSALAVAKERELTIPIVYNSNGYDDPETLSLLDGIVDIYMPDLKFASSTHASRYAKTPGYVESARAALREMVRQLGDAWTVKDGILVRGILVRLLVLPGDVSGTVQSIRWIAETLSPRLGISLMAQYYPVHRASEPPYGSVLGRRISRAEWQEVREALDRWMPEAKGFIQDPVTSPDHYRPDFRDPENPFRTADMPSISAGSNAPGLSHLEVSSYHKGVNDASREHRTDHRTGLPAK